MRYIFKKSKMLDRLKKEGRINQLDDISVSIMDKLDGCPAKPNTWRRTVYGEENAWYATDATGAQYPVSPADLEEIPDEKLFQIFAYDKDNDQLCLLWETKDASAGRQASIIANELKTFSDKILSEKIKTPNGEPYDWVELYVNGERVMFI